MFCPSCGKQNPDDAKFCESCGGSLSVADAPQKAQPSNPVHAYAPPPPPPPPPPPQPQSYAYQQPSYAPVNNDAPMSVGQYLGTIILFGIPIVGFILMLVWAFGSSVNTNKKNYSRAMLILAVIGIVLGIIMSGTLIALFANLFDSMNYY
jgi:hypothetical protein